MSNGIKFKIVKTYRMNSMKKNKNAYYEIPYDPSYDGDILLLCNKSELSFDEVIYILEKKHKKVYLFGAISFVYWKYSVQFWQFIQECNEEKYKIIKKKCTSYFRHLFEFLKKSDDSLYTQNVYIRNVYYMLKNKRQQ